MMETEIDMNEGCVTGYSEAKRLSALAATVKG